MIQESSQLMSAKPQHNSARVLSLCGGHPQYCRGKRRILPVHNIYKFVDRPFWDRAALSSVQHLMPACQYDRIYTWFCRDTKSSRWTAFGTMWKRLRPSARRHSDRILRRDSNGRNETGDQGYVRGGRCRYIIWIRTGRRRGKYTELSSASCRYYCVMIILSFAQERKAMDNSLMYSSPW